MKKVFTPAAKVINVILMVTPFLLCWFFYYEPRTMTVNSAQVSVILIALYCMAYCYLARRLDGFRLQIAQVRDLSFGQIISVAATYHLDAVSAFSEHVAGTGGVCSAMCAERDVGHDSAQAVFQDASAAEVRGGVRCAAGYGELDF